MIYRLGIKPAIRFENYCQIDNITPNIFKIFYEDIVSGLYNYLGFKMKNEVEENNPRPYQAIIFDETIPAGSSILNNDEENEYLAIRSYMKLLLQCVFLNIHNKNSIVYDDFIQIPCFNWSTSDDSLNLAVYDPTLVEDFKVYQLGNYTKPLWVNFSFVNEIIRRPDPIWNENFLRTSSRFETYSLHKIRDYLNFLNDNPEFLPGAWSNKKNGEIYHFDEFKKKIDSLIDIHINDYLRYKIDIQKSMDAFFIFLHVCMHILFHKIHDNSYYEETVIEKVNIVRKRFGLPERMQWDYKFKVKEQKRYILFSKDNQYYGSILWD